MAGKYATGTDVPVDRTRGEIEKVLSRYGATQFMYGWDTRRAVLAFIANEREVRFVLPLPDRESNEFTATPTGRARTDTAAQQAYDQAVRTRWRALSLVIRAKLEAVETGIVTFEQEFLAHLVLPDGTTVGDTVAPRLREVYDSGYTSELLPQYPKAIES